MRFRLRVHAFVALAVLAGGCARQGQDAAAGRHSWTQAGTLRVAIREPKTLNPLLASSTIDGAIIRLMFEPLVSADTHGIPVPMLARTVPTLENGGISRDGLTVTYRLRPDARWSDGVPVTAQDVRWTWSAIMNPANDVVTRHGYDDVAAIDTPDATTAVVHLKAPFAPFVNTFFAESDQPYQILPAHALARYPNVNEIPFNAEPTVSDGPFRFGAWRRGDGIDLVANPGFFEGKPGLDRIHLIFVSNDNSAASLLEGHEIDYFFEAPIELYTTLSRLPDARMDFVEMNGFEGLQYNLARAPLDDADVRRAIAAAIDKSALVATLVHGQARQATGDIPYWMWAYDPSVASVPFDVAASARLLASRGWRPGPDGILRKNGVPLELLLVSDVGATHRTEAVLLQSALRRVGIDLSIKFYPESALYAPAGMGGIIHGGKFDLALAPWISGIDPDDSSQFTCANFPPGGYNDSRYCNPDMEAAQRQALTQYAKERRKAAYAKIQRILVRDNPEIFFWWERYLQPVSVDFKGFAPNPVSETWNAWQWSI